MWHLGVATRLTPAQQKVLISHIDGPQSVVVVECAPSRKWLLQSRLLRGCNERGNNTACSKKRIKWTTLTADGRRVIACLLAMEADRLSAENKLLPDEPIRRQVVKEILTRRGYGPFVQTREPENESGEYQDLSIR